MQTYPKNRSPNNIPLQLDNFVGRKEEIKGICARLETTRLLTLTGTGGCGKTRLGIEVAMRMLDSRRFVDGIWLVELAAVADSAFVAPTLATALGVRQISERSLLDVLAAYLAPRNLLILLDNCEHLVTTCAQLAANLLQRCPQLQILATSREVLRIPGESIWAVPPLSLPADGTPSVADLSNYEAVQLFIERTKAVESSFTLNDENAAAVSQICHQLDGLPLAIELAAARANVLPVSEIAGRLDDALNLLTTGDRTALPRHQTLRATIDWSYKLLSEAPQERALLRRLSVFAGGFTLEAVEAVCVNVIDKNVNIIKEDILNLLMTLIDKSLVVRQKQETPARYRLLEPIRQYAAKLLEPSEKANLKQHHAQFFLELAENVEPCLNWPDRHTWLTHLEVDHDNLRAVLSWAVAGGEWVRGLRLASALWWFWFHRGYWSEGRHWLTTLMAGSEEFASAPATVQAKSLLGAGVLAWAQGDHAAARAQLEGSVALFRQLDDKQNLGYAVQFLSQEALGQGEFSRAGTLADESVKISRETGDRFGLAISLVTAGIGAQLREEPERAETWLTESAAVAREVGDNWALALALRNLGYLAARQGDFAAAAAWQRESLATLRNLDEKWFVSRSLEALAEACALDCNYVRAAQLFGASEALREAVGAAILAYYEDEYQRGVAATRKALGEETFALAWAQGRTLTVGDWKRAIDAALADEPETTDPTGAGETAANASLTRSKANRAESPAEEKICSSSELHIRALGSARVLRNQQLLTAADWTYAKPKELLFYLLSRPPQTKEQIGLALWPDASPAQLRSSFHTTLHHVRRALGSAKWITFEEGRYAFRRSSTCWYDVDLFTFNLDAAHQFEIRDPSQAIHHLREAARLYQGDFLADFVDGEWCWEEREALRRRLLNALLLLGQLLFQKGEYSEAAGVYRQAIVQDNLLEVAHRELMRCHAHLGERVHVLRQYQALCRLLEDELDVPPAPETTALVEQLRQGKMI